ncbi:MAG TPA: NADH dehydrogenase (quinone) subunit G [Anaerolineae bacterium]|nr:NADH dehydrogenase (quinone) subunit G [Anaerolineae bacterium]
MSDWITITIDGKEIQAKPGELLTEAAARAGIHIPVFCSHPKLDPLGACRMCLVEMEGRRGKMLVTACTTPVNDGMVFYYNSERARDARAGTLELILANHPLDCPICDKGGECDLQDHAMRHGPGESHYWEPNRHKEKNYPLSDLIVLDQERCIVCWRCIRYLDEWEDKPQLGLFQRGADTVIDKFPGGDLDAYTSGNIIDICPVGALTNRLARFRFRPWVLEHTNSICTHCGMGCNLRIDTRDFRVRRNVARANEAVNETWICDKGRFANGFVFSQQRLTQPLARIDGELRPVSWPEAIQRVVDGLKRVAAKEGPAAVGGIGSAKLANEANYLLGKFMRALVGTNNVDFREGSSLKADPRGIPSIQAAREADLVVVMGSDPSEEMPVLANLLKRAAKRRGAPVIVIHPRRIELTKYPGVHFHPQPGDEPPLFDALTKATLQARGQAVPDWLAGAEVTDEVKEAATLLVNAQNPFIIYGTDYAWGYGSASIVQALTNWVVASGHGDRLGFLHAQANAVGAADVGLLPDMLPGHRPLSDAAARAELEALWGASIPTQPGLGYSGMIASALGRIKALYIMGADPVGEKPSYADHLKALEFLVVQDLFLTETAKLADVVLPAASYVESNGTFTSTERRVQAAPQAARAVGDSLPDWAILMHIARRYAPDKADFWRTASAPAVFEEITRAVPQYAGMSWEGLGETGQQWAWDALEVSRKLAPYAKLEPAPLEKPFTFRLITGNLLWDDGNTFAATERLAQLGHKAAWLHPDDAAGLDLSEGDLIAVRSREATLELPLHISRRVLPGTVFVPFSLKDAPVGELFDEFGPRTTVAVYRA